MIGNRILGPVGAMACLMLTSTMLGCAEDDGRRPVTGTVQIGDQPIRGGFVTFDPASTSNGHARQGRAVIRDGRFDTSEGGEPVIMGPVLIRIQGWGEPSERFPTGIPVCHNYEIRMQLDESTPELELKVPESARVQPPQGGWGEGP